MLGVEIPQGVLVLGVLTGLSYGLLAVGLVLVFRSSRIVNFAHGEIGAFAAAIMGLAVTRWHSPYWVAFPLALLLGAAIGGGSEVVIIRRLRNTPPVMSVVATLGLAQLLSILALVVNPSASATKLFPSPPFLPTFDVGALRVTRAHMAVLILGPVLVAALAWFLSRTRLGMSMRAAAANPDAARLAGVSASRMSVLAWSLAGAVAAFTAILVLPTRGFASVQFLGPGLLLRALAAAVIARMESLPIALGAGVGVGVIEQVVLWNKPQGGVADAVLFGIILVALLAQRQLRGRGTQEGSWVAVQAWPPPPARLRRVWVIRNLGWVVAAAATVVGLIVPLVATNATSITTAIVLAFALVGLSVGIVTGLAGQLSLGQFALAGVGATVAASVAGHAGHIIGLVVGGLVAAAVSLVIGLPAVRIRGLLLAVSTLGFALIAQSWLFQQSWMMGDGKTTGRPSLFGARLDTGKKYELFALAVFLVGLWLTRNAWRSGIGRRMRAVRDDEDTARAFTVSTTRTKLQAFALAGFLAGVGGGVYAYALAHIDAAAFPVGLSFDAAAMAVIGGLGLLAGPVLGALYIAGLPRYLPLDNAGLMATALGWLLLVLYIPGGIAQLLRPIRDRILRIDPQPPAEDTDEDVEVGLAAGAVLERTLPAPAVAPGDVVLATTNLRKHFGGVVAVDDVSLEVRAGETLGLIGPNGAGKTTLFEVIGGFIPADAGTVTYAGRDVTALGAEARAGLGLVRSFQDAALFPTLSVHEVIQVALERAEPTRFLPSVLGLSGGEKNAARADALIELMGLERFRDKAVAELSTGTRRIAELACMLALEPTVLLLDEPAAGIAQRETEALGDLLIGIKQLLGLTLVVVEHDIPLVMRLADRVIAMETGRVIADGTPDEIRRDPEVIASYLGDDPTAVERSGAVKAGARG
ncbi:MAG: ATP-binding cassette domain-containing protein [Actinobacteria bacterium]|nr:ATP-binding cassette domain-containing protein [Actinomycetota bacterium]